MMFGIRSGKILAGAFLMFGLSSCSPSMDGAIETPEVPVADVARDKQLNGYIEISVLDFADVRALDTNAEGAAVDVTKPEGDVGLKVGAAVSEALSKRGAIVNPVAPLRLKGDILTWESRVGAKGMGSIESKASLYVQVVDRDGKQLFSGIYNGNRASQFPVVSRNDVKHSLGMAMSETITQVLEDQRFQRALSSMPSSL